MTQPTGFRFTDRDFRCIQELVGRHVGIQLPEAKRDMVYCRLSRRLRALGLKDFASYCRLLRTEEGGDELEEFSNAITTNLTAFFREPHHFEYLEREWLPGRLREGGRPRRLRAWSAGCSSGEEPYSLAMVLAEAVPADWDVRVLATDLDTRVLATARRGVYDASRIRDVPPERVRRWFYRGRGANAGQVRVSPVLQDMIQFRQLNLSGPWPLKGPLDFIFCRNVLIYFDKAAQKRITERFADLLVDGGLLFLGHSETLYRVTDRYELLGRTVYRRRAA